MATDLRHYVATTRRVGMTDTGEYFYEHESNNPADTANPYFRCGQYVDDDGIPENPWFCHPGNEDYDYVIKDGTPTDEQLTAGEGSAEMFNMLLSELEHAGKDMLIFIFGYHNPFGKERDHLNRLHTKYVSPPESNIGRILMLTWPSQGFGEYNKELGYFQKLVSKSGDQINSDVAVTGKALAVFLCKLKKFMDARYTANPHLHRPKLNIIVQSMANHVWLRMMEKLTAWNKTALLKSMMSNLMLTSPDIRSDIFQQSELYKRSTDLAERAYIIYSLQDRILRIATVVHGVPGASRLGLTGPDGGLTHLPGNTHLINVNQSMKKLKPVDFNHRYFEYNNAVIDIYNSIFLGNFPGRAISISG